MQVRKIAAFVAAVTIMIALAAGVSAPANAQGWHHDAGVYRNGRPGFVHGYHGGFYHGGYRPYPGGRAYYHGPVYYHHPVYYARPAYYGPGYAHYSWGWYRNHPGYWRAAHPYHGSPTLGVWIHL